MKTEKAALVYQAGIANVFAVESWNLSDYGREARRLIQGDFRTCEAFARGLDAAGCRVASFCCNRAGDIASAHWYTLGEGEVNGQAPFRESFRPVYSEGISRHEHWTPKAATA